MEMKKILDTKSTKSKCPTLYETLSIMIQNYVYVNIALNYCPKHTST